MMLRKSFFAVLALTVCAWPAAAQSTAKRFVQFSVSDPLNRFVTGLDQDTFEVVESGGVRRPITAFSGVDSPIALAIVSQAPLPDASRFNRPDDELFQAQSVEDAMRQLSAAKNSRKIMVVSAAFNIQAVPRGIQVVQATPEILLKAVVEVHNQYLVQFESASSVAPVEVVIRQQPRGLPPLKVHVN